MDFNSKYTGEQVEGFLDQIANGEIGGGGRGALPKVVDIPASGLFSPNTFYSLGEQASLDIILSEPSESMANEYIIQFSCPRDKPTEVVFRSTVFFDNVLKPLQGMTYRIHIIDNLASYKQWERYESFLVEEGDFLVEEGEFLVKL